MRSSLKKIVPVIVLISGFIACKSGDKKEAAVPAEEKTGAGGTPVTLIEPTTGNMSESIELNAVSSFRLRTYVKASATGYLQLVNAE